jgi:hypothetical protein
MKSLIGFAAVTFPVGHTRDLSVEFKPGYQKYKKWGVVSERGDPAKSSIVWRRGFSLGPFWLVVTRLRGIAHVALRPWLTIHHTRGVA